MAEMVREQGKEAIIELKRDYYNLNLEDCVIGANQKRVLDVIDNHIVARTGIIYLTPKSKVGRAPFYSSEKILGSWHIKTLWYNLGIMLIMSIVIAIFLFIDWPGRVLRK